MVKMILSVSITLLLLIGLGIFEHHYVEKQFDEFREAVEILQEKTKNKTASSVDGKTVQTLWDDKKEKLHIIIPHNNIANVDNWISETIGLIETEHYEFALSKIQVLIDICEQIPDTYGISLENLF